MKGGRGPRGGGKGGGDVPRSSAMNTRSARKLTDDSTEKTNGDEGFKGNGEFQSVESDSQCTEDARKLSDVPIEIAIGDECFKGNGGFRTGEDDAQNQKCTKEDGGEAYLKSELLKLKLQLEALKSQFQKMNETEETHSVQKPQSALNRNGRIQTLLLDDFPTFGNSSAATKPVSLAGTNQQQASWKDKVSTPSALSLGMPLKFVPPSLENGKPVLHIEAQDVENLAKIWDNAVVFYVVGGKTSVDIIRGFIRKQWSHVIMPTIHEHEDGFFILKFKIESECSEILKGGPYFLNRAPIVIKKWSANFDFKSEILRVIPVWVRLPSLPLHCWGAETLSRIVSAVGVPVLADECTMNQRKVSYARVLVEVDITQDFVKDISVRDNTGRDFIQKAIPEWRPFFCRKCNKVGHDCRDKNEPLHHPRDQPGIAEKETSGDRKMWIPRTIAKVLKGAMSVEELRSNLATVAPQEKEKLEIECNPSHKPQNQNINSKNTQKEGNEEGWTPVAPGKAARRHRPTATGSDPQNIEIEVGNGRLEERMESVAPDFTCQQRGGNPQISSPQ